MNRLILGLTALLASAALPVHPALAQAPAPVEVPVPDATPAPPAPDAREKGVIMRRDPAPEAKRPDVRAESSAPRTAARSKRAGRYAAPRRRPYRLVRRYRADPAAAAFAGIANTIVGGVLSVFGEPHRYDYTYGYPVLVRPYYGYDYTYGPPRYRRW